MSLARLGLCFVGAALVACQSTSSATDTRLASGGAGPTGGAGSGGVTAAGGRGAGGSSSATSPDAAIADGPVDRAATPDDAFADRGGADSPPRDQPQLADSDLRFDGSPPIDSAAPDGASNEAGRLDAQTPDVPSTLPTADGGALACVVPWACTDFPTAPILDPLSPTPVPANPETQFTSAPSGPSPCVTEPEDGALFPSNWTRPRIRWVSPRTSTPTLAQITVHADIEANDLVVYTLADHWVMDAPIWQGLAAHVREADVSVTVRFAGEGATTVKFQIANAATSGSIVFWAADPAAIGNMDLKNVPDTSAYLRGFMVGEENTVSTLKFSQVQQQSREQSFEIRRPTCIGCHAATPDPDYIAFVDNMPWNSVIAGVAPDNVGTSLPGLTVGGLAALNKPWAGAATFARSAWMPGKRIMVTTSSQQDDLAPWSTDNKKPAKLVWYNLDGPPPSAFIWDAGVASPGQQYGVIARDGDDHGVAFPTWSHDGSTIVYSSTNGGCLDGRLDRGATNLYAVPFADGNGGKAMPVPGAADANWEEYYAAYSPDDKLLAFNRVPSGETMYANSKAELFVVPVGAAPGAGTAIRLDGNDPAACTGMTSPGVNNHYARWAPEATSFNGTTYYWLVYASNRAGLEPVRSKYDQRLHSIAQLYLTAMTVKDGVYKTYKSLYLWWQPTVTTNLTPVWDNLRIPPAP